MFWIPAVVAAFVLAGWFLASRFELGSRAAMDDVQQCGASRRLAQELPPLVANYLARVDLPRQRGRRWTRIEQRGQMRLSIGGKWKPFEAVQYSAVAEPRFVWKGKMGPLRVLDGILSGVGRLDARLLGVLPQTQAPSSAVPAVSVTRAQLTRYLGEVVWVPGAIANNPHITWRQLSEGPSGGGTAAAKLTFGGEAVELVFTFNDLGDISRVEGNRACAIDGRTREVPWVGVYSDYGTVDGVRIPRQSEVQWHHDSGQYVYWRGKVVGIGLDGATG